MAADIKELVCKSRGELILFHLLDEDEVGKIIPYMEAVDYPKGATVFREGDPADFVGFISYGHLEVKKQTEFKDKQIVVAILGKGSFVGELSLADRRQPRSTTVEALENSELIILRHEALETIIDKYPHIAIKILKGLNQVLVIRLRKAVERLAAVF
ncbi:MAG: cyclic nucleotide-binding domain-containing protein [Nitrospiraceae bacterium]|nr:MAG: cyclic nucleotide-binding domain-containing protein [Nitrospiraceae bacterium]